MVVLTQAFNEYRSINVEEIYPYYPDVVGTISAYDIVVYDKYLWKAVIDDPPDEPTLYSVNWVKWGPSNKYAALDERGSTETICDVNTSTTGAPYTMVMELAWDGFDTLVISNAIAAGVKIELTTHNDPTFANVVWTHEVTADTRTCVTGWFAYFNVNRQCGVKSIDDTINFAVKPPAIIGIMRITYTQSTTWPKSSVGIVFGGFSYYLGCTIYPIGIGLEDFSKHEADEYGTVVLIRRKSRRSRKIRTWVQQIDILRIEDYIKENILGNSVLFIGDESDSSIFYGLMTLGYLEDFDVSIKKENEQAIDFDIKEMI